MHDVITSPPYYSTDIESLDTSSAYSYPPDSSGQEYDAGVGTGVTGGGEVVQRLGNYASGAVHMGTGSDGDTSTGLLSQLGSGDVHAMRVEDGEMSESLTSSGGGGDHLVLMDGTGTWQASPTGLGYRRPNGGGVNKFITNPDSTLQDGAMDNGTDVGSAQNAVKRKIGIVPNRKS